MGYRSYSSVFVLAAVIAGSCLGADVGKVEIGKAKPSWKNLPGTDGEMHSLSDLRDKKIVVVAITCNHCPIAMEYFDRLKEFSKEYCQKNGSVALIAISVSHEETDKLPRMKEIAERKGFNYPYLYDETQQIAKALGATVTPQFFVLGPDRTLVYRGAWDDSVNQAKAKSWHVEEVVQALLSSDSPPVAETKSIGCPITFAK